VETIHNLTKTVVRSVVHVDQDSDLKTREYFRVIPFGSYGLGVHSPTSDMDILVTSSNFMRRETLVEELLRLLEASDQVTCVKVKSQYPANQSKLAH
jgi:poly(A) polymerase Pap1